MTSDRAPMTSRVKHITRKHLLIGLFAAMGALTAHAAEPKTIKLSMQAQKGFFAEQCFVLEAGQKLSYQFNVPHPIEFNLHHHRNDGQTVFPDRLVVNAQHSKQMVAESTGAYCFMATNVSDQPGPFDVVVSYEIAAK